MRTRPIIMLASVAIILVMAGVGSAFASLFGDQVQVSAYSGGSSALWLAKITNTGVASGHQLTWDNNWYNWATYTVTAYAQYKYPSSTSHYYYVQGSEIGPNQCGTQTVNQTTSSADGTTIYNLKNLYFGDEGLGSTSTWNLYFTNP